MAVSAAAKALLAELGGQPWASSESAQRQTPADAGIDDADGWGLAYEQHGTGRRPERLVFNEIFWRATSALLDVFAAGVASWDAGVDYAVDAVVASGGHLWIAVAASGPSSGEPTDPALAGQTVWRRF